MIERKIVEDRVRQVMVEQFLTETLDKVGYSHTEIHKTPLGEKVIIHASRPGLIVGAKGSNVKKLTKLLKTRFNFENPQIEIEEVKEIRLDPKLVAENIASSMERFGIGRFKAEGYRAVDQAIIAGALGVEILISGRVPSSRAKRWRFYKGYLKKCGDVAFTGVKTAYCIAKLKSGVVGIQVRIMPPDLILPDKIIMGKNLVVEESEETIQPEGSEETTPASEATPKDAAKEEVKKAPKKKVAKKESKDESVQAEKPKKTTRKPRAKKKVEEDGGEKA
jgi:small subunit ribosomal protein S3